MVGLKSRLHLQDERHCVLKVKDVWGVPVARRVDVALGRGGHDQVVKAWKMEGAPSFRIAMERM